MFAILPGRPAGLAENAHLPLPLPAYLPGRGSRGPSPAPRMMHSLSLSCLQVPECLGLELGEDAHLS